LCYKQNHQAETADILFDRNYYGKWALLTIMTIIEHESISFNCSRI